MTDPTRLPRRSFLLAAGAAVTACKTGKHASGVDRTTSLTSSSAHDVPRRALGTTGVNVSAIGLGGYHVGSVDGEDESVKLVHAAIDRGIDFLDNSWDYHGGRSEERVGKALANGYRQKAFVMTKLDGRTKKAALDQLEQSLRRLRTDIIDLIQIHEVIRPTDPARCFADDGCIHALEQAKKDGKVRFIGFTGHKDPSIHLAMLRAADEHGFRFDTVQMPLNVMDAHFRSFEREVLPRAVERRMGVCGMKSMGAGKILKSKTVGAIDCLHYAMSLPTSVVITGCEKMRDLDQAIEAARTFRQLDENEMNRLRDRTRDAARDGEFERFKTSDDHDSTAKHPEWLEKA